MGDLVADIIPIHLMVTDVVMSEMNKRELAEHLARSRCSGSPGGGGGKGGNIKPTPQANLGRGRTHKIHSSVISVYDTKTLPPNDSGHHLRAGPPPYGLCRYVVHPFGTPSCP